MPIKTLSVQARELGRIRMGQKVPAREEGKTRPAKLDTLRFTSRRRDLIELVAERLGGTSTEWADAPGEARQWDLVTDADVVDVLLPQAPLSQWFELWTADGLQRRCDGERELTRNDPNDQGPGRACVCPADPDARQAAAADGEACKPTSRLQLLIPWLPDIGVWLLVTHGYYAAAELAGVTQMLAVAGEQRGLEDRGAGLVIPARLRLDRRTVKKPGQKPHHFAVPAIEIGAPLGRVLESLGQLDTGSETGELPAGDGAAIPAHVPAPRALPEDAELDELIEECAALGITLPEVALRGHAANSPEHRTAVINRLRGEITAARARQAADEVPF